MTIVNPKKIVRLVDENHEQSPQKRTESWYLI